MLEHFAILSETGLVLWAESLNDEDQQETVMHQPLNALVKNVLLEQRHSQKTYTHGNYAMKWTLENELDLIFVVVFNRIIGSHLTYLDDLLMNVKKVSESTGLGNVKIIIICSNMSYSAGVPENV